MGSIFNLDGPVFRTLSRFADLIIINILWMICCIPVFTIGASTTALYTVCLKMAKEEEGYIIRSFFKAFIQNFKQATIITLIYLVIASVIGADLFIVTAMSETMGQFILPMRILAYGGAMLLFFISEFTFPVLAKFENTIKNTIKNSFLMEVGSLGYFLLITVMNVILYILAFINPATISKLIFIWLLFGASVPAYLNSFLFQKIFHKYMK